MPERCPAASTSQPQPEAIVDGMRWWLTAGLLLQVIGLVLAVWGVASTKGDLFPGHPLPHRRAWSWTKRTVRRRQGRTHTLEVSGSIIATSAMSAFVQTLPGRPDPDATAGEWGTYLERKVDNLAELREHDHREWKERTDRLGSSLDTERTERVADVARLEQRIGIAVGGEGGSGLDMAWWGLTLTLVGTVVAGVAGIVGA